MAISFPLVAKGLAGLAAIGAPVTASVYYKDNIYGLFVSKAETDLLVQEPKQTDKKNPTEIIKKLGIETTATFSNQNWELNLTRENLQQLKLLDTNGENTVEGLDSETVKLKIESINNNFFPEEFKFTLTSSKDSDVTIKKTVSGTEQSITLKKDERVEFKLKVESNNYSLEKLLSEEEMKSNLKLNCESDNSCTIQENQKINVKDGDKKIENVAFKTDQTDAKIKFEKYQKDYKNDFRFYVDKDIELQGGSESETPNSNKLFQSASYEAIKDGDKWYLSKKSSIAS